MQTTTTQPLFSAALKPNTLPSLAGGWAAIALAGLVASPVIFISPEILLPAGIAFGLSGVGLVGLGFYRARSRRQLEQVRLWAEQLEVSVVDTKGNRSLQRFDPRLVRLNLRRDANEKTRAILLQQGDIELEIGRFLSPEERSSFARAFGTALRQARRAG